MTEPTPTFDAGQAPDVIECRPCPACQGHTTVRSSTQTNTGHLFYWGHCADEACGLRGPRRTAYHEARNAWNALPRADDPNLTGIADPPSRLISVTTTQAGTAMVFTCDERARTVNLNSYEADRLTATLLQHFPQPIPYQPDVAEAPAKTAGHLRSLNQQIEALEMELAAQKAINNRATVASSTYQDVIETIIRALKEPH